MITLRLQGSLAACVRPRLSDADLRRSSEGEAVLDLDARSVIEALRLLAPQVPNLEWTLKMGSFRITADGKPMSAEELDVSLPDRTYVSVAPALAGSGPAIPVWGKVLLYIAGAVAVGEYIASQIPSIPDLDHLEHGERRTLFSGPVNSNAQGGAVPLIYGRTRVGSVVVSGGITQERPTGGDYADPPAMRLGGDRPPGFDRARLDRGRDALRPNISTDAGDASEERSVMRVIDLLGEGEIEGLVDGLKSVYIDDIAVQDEDGDTNLEGVSIQERKGLPHGAAGQAALTGFDATSTDLGRRRTELVANTPVDQNVPQGYDAVRVTLYFPRLLEYDENGNEIATEVRFRIQSRPGASGNWTTVLTQTMRDRSLDDQEASWRVERPDSVGASGTWQVRVERLSPAATSTKVHNDVHLQRVSGLRDVKQTYPHSALVGVTIEADRVEVNPTRRQYEVRGRKVLTPPNSVWNPNRATSTHAAAYGGGLWDGSGMVRRFTDNPAWIAYDLLTDPRAGLGDVPGMVAAARQARAYFLALSRRCDELVPAPNSATEMEPRWRFNGVIQKREQARKVVDWVLSACRAGALWSEGAIDLTIDGESDVAASIGNANVIDGEFDYQGLRSQERYSAVAVTWQDPVDGYQSGVELVVDHGLVAKYGFRQKNVAAIGCTSRGKAHGVGLLILNAQDTESETARFGMALEGMDLRPGDRIRIADRHRFGVRAAFRVKSVDTSTAGQETITLDDDAPRLIGGGRIVWGENGEAAVVRAQVGRDDLLRTTDVPTGLMPGDLVVNKASVIDWIVTRLSERDELEVNVEARRHDAQKYTAVEERRELAPPLVDPYAAILAPTAVTVRETTYMDGNQVRSQLEIAVRGGDDTRIDRVEYWIQRPTRSATPEEIAAGDPSALPRGPWEPLRITDARSIVEKNVALGGYRLRARFIGRRRRSDWTMSAELVADGKTDPLAAPAGLEAAAAAGGYWVKWTAVTEPDYWYTEIYDREGDPGPAEADVDLSEAGWTFRGRISGTAFRRVGTTTTDNLRVAVRHVDTSRLRTVAREVGVTPATLAANDGVGFEWQGTWSASHGTYRTVDDDHAVRDVVAYDGRTWICVQTHASAADKAPPAGDSDATSNTWWELLANHGDPGEDGDSFMWRGAWTSGVEYELRDCVSSDHRSWICVLGHTSSSANQPTEDNGGIINGTRHWDLLADRGDIGPEANDGVGFEWQGGWSASHGTYRTVDDDNMVRDVVSHEGRTWICRSTHEAAANRAPPGTDSDATSNTWWELLANHGDPGVDGDSFMWRGAWVSGREYSAQECVANDGRSWICTSDHESTAGNAPTEANNGGTFWDLLADRGDPGDNAPRPVSITGGSITFGGSAGAYTSRGQLVGTYPPGLSKIENLNTVYYDEASGREPQRSIRRMNSPNPAGGVLEGSILGFNTNGGVAASYYAREWVSSVVTFHLVDGVEYASGPVGRVVSGEPGTTVTRPAAPLAPTVSASGRNVTIRGTAAARATSYRLQRRTGPSGSWTTIVNSTTNLTQNDRNRPDGTYYYRFVAVNSAGSTTGATSSSITIDEDGGGGGTDGQPPSAPSTTAVGGERTYTLTASRVTGDGTVRYRFWWRQNSSGSWVLLTTWNTSRSYTQSNAPTGTHQFAAEAQDDDGSSGRGTSDSATVTEPAPQAPGRPTISGGTLTHDGNGNTVVTVRVTESTSGDAATALSLQGYGGSGLGWYNIATGTVVTGNITITVTSAASRGSNRVWSLTYRINNHEASTATLRAVLSNATGSSPTSANRTIS
ncbi:MAG: hypothetical protein F4Y16_18090 [Holophagales bacterium]|nr:hypothetical protein [Holophagales bacterium]